MTYYQCQAKEYHRAADLLVAREKDGNKQSRLDALSKQSRDFLWTRQTQKVNKARKT
jgi:hypothetical protein